MIPNDDGTYTIGPLDILCILHDEINSGRFHPAMLEERPMPGTLECIEDMTFARLKSKMHHTTGFGTLEEARANLRDDLSRRLRCDNVWYDPLPWDGDPFVCILPVENGKIGMPPTV